MKEPWKRLAAATAVLAGVLAAAVLFWPLAYEKVHRTSGPDPLQLVYTDGQRSWFLDTRSLRLKTEPETGIPYLEVDAKLTYTFTDGYDLNHYWMRTGSRQWQPISATGCDREGNVVES
jgi:hypothetical protein